MESINFKVSKEIQLTNINKAETFSIKQRLENNSIFKDTKFEAFDNSTLLKLPSIPHCLSLNGFAEAIHLAYDQHHGLTLAPHHLFITILQGLAIHVNLNGDKYQEQLGLGTEKREGKENIDIRRDSFILGQTNPWEELFPEFVDIISTKVKGDIHHLLAKPFSTSDELTIAVTSLTIMDLYKNFFTYSVTTMCGIPEITLLGTLEDWKDLIIRIKTLLNKFEDLEFWTNELIPVLEQFVQVKQDPIKINEEFWTSLYKPSGGSGGPYINGWIGVFYPYLQESEGYTKNRYINWKEDQGMFSGLTYDQIPVGFTKTPFVWNYYSEKHNMNFIGGFLGVKESTVENHVEPAISWAISYDP